MSNPIEREAEDLYERDNDPSPVTGTVTDNDYVGETNPDYKDTVPVQEDEQPVEDPVQPPYSNSNEQLEQDEKEAIDQSNVLRGERLRHAKPRTSNRYNEGPDETDLPAME
ncbi:uncharacterized protein N7473_002412 [Penicillium subrubescens]|uniref:Histone chaperone domain-containing protein n=1 Tax=Penicillium subrubescens TaxID=1316194 RepID=A0A1Q5UJY8_9EURO|nr:uncharacterized protein N7473_002412 [Penicillium subrubescens]KAJ5905496.1 hypothetical protein N7473_002412 [Penicillium subrubescens]OKP12791.1 hypothetical protein PENSUB_1523 [Penicillium subrubescens]